MIIQILDTDFVIEDRCFLFSHFKQTFSFSLRYCEKASKFGEISHLVLELLSNVKSKQIGLLFQIFVAFSEYLNFINKIKNLTKIAIFLPFVFSRMDNDPG